jgi:hypothetical protein
MAPLCEEFMFRGVIQPVYETRGAKWGVIFVGLLFIVFHLSLLQGLSIILLALALGFVNYSTRSLQASIATQDNGPLTEKRTVAVTGREDVDTPSGRITAWKVAYGDNQAAWFDASDSRTVVKFTNSIETWYLR